MSHVPERPQLYVCDDCHVVYAGTHEEGHTFSSPERCSVCENDSFHRIQDYPRSE